MSTLSDNNLPNIKRTWVRPADVPYPTVWSKLSVRYPASDGHSTQIRIQDAPLERTEEVVHFMTENFLTREPLAKYCGMRSDEVSASSHRHIWRECLKSGVSLVALATSEGDRADEIVAVQLLMVHAKNDPPFPRFPGSAMNVKRGLIDLLFRKIKLSDTFEDDLYVRDFGLCVAEPYGRLGIGSAMLATVPSLCRAYHLRGHVIVFSTGQSDMDANIASRLGYSVKRWINYSDYRDENGSRVINVPEGEADLKIIVATYVLPKD